MFIASGLLALILLVPAVSAQELPKAEMRQDVDYYVVSYTKFKHGMGDEAMRLIYDHFWPIDKAIGRKVIPFDAMTGEWDHIVYFLLSEGTGELAWKTSMTDEEWMSAFVSREGSFKQAQALLQRFDQLIADSKTEVVMTKW